MSADGRAWGWGAVVVVLAVAAGVWVDGRASRAPVRLDPPALGAHVASVDGCPTWTLLAGHADVRGADAILLTDGVLRLEPCPGRPAALTLRGTAVAGVGAWAVATDAQGVVFAGYVDGDGVALAPSGPVFVSFSNDLARGEEDRNLRAIAR